jgi:hypothetical protein
MNPKKPKKLQLKRNQKSSRYFFEKLRQEIEATSEGKLRVPGLGIFIVKTTNKEKEGQAVSTKRILLRLSGGETGRRGRVADDATEPSSSEEGA